MEYRKKSYYQKTFEVLTHFYDIADELLATVPSIEVSRRGEYFQIIEPLVKMIQTSTKRLLEVYKDYIISGKVSDDLMRSKAESALKAIHDAIEITRSKLERFDDEVPI